MDDNTATAFRPKTNYFISINPGASDQNSQSPYNSSSITVPAGSYVIWTNNDPSTGFHSIASGDPAKGPTNIFYSELVPVGEQIKILFDKPGVYQYYDRSWPHMKGVVTVEPNTTPTS